MAEVPVTLNGVLFDLWNKTSQRVVLIGDASLTGLGIGGGPMPPGPGQPPVGGPPGQPIHPIWGPPGFNPPGPGMPPGIWGGAPPLYPDIGFPIPQPPPGGGRPPGRPTFPIWGPPGIDLPPGSGYPPVAGHPLPPVPPGTEPPKPIANWEAVPVWTAEQGWSVVLVPTGDQPIPTPSKG